MFSLRRLTDSLVGAIESSRSLDSLGRLLTQAFVNVVPLGSVKDFLAGTWLGHPLHPLLTDVPIGAWTSAVTLDLLGGEDASGAARTLTGLGVLAALPTAVSGLSDLADVVNADERRLGAAHAIGNTWALTLFALSYVRRRAGGRRAGVGLSMAAMAVAAGSAYLGGHLVYRKVIGPSRAADGRIREWTPVLDAEELKEMKPKRVAVGTSQVMLYRRAGRTYALGNVCSHRGGPLHKGTIRDDEVVCPWHLSSFSLKDGSITRGPATAPQPVYDVREQNGKIEIRARESS